METASVADPHVFGPPDPNLLVRGMDPDSRWDSYYFVALFDFLSLKNYVNVSSKSNKQKKFC